MTTTSTPTTTETQKAGDFRFILQALTSHAEACTCPCHDYRACDWCIEKAVNLLETTGKAS